MLGFVRMLQTEYQFRMGLQLGFSTRGRCRRMDAWEKAQGLAPPAGTIPASVQPAAESSSQSNSCISSFTAAPEGWRRQLASASSSEVSVSAVRGLSSKFLFHLFAVLSSQPWKQ